MSDKKTRTAHRENAELLDTLAENRRLNKALADLTDEKNVLASALSKALSEVEALKATPAPAETEAPAEAQPTA